MLTGRVFFQLENNTKYFSGDEEILCNNAMLEISWMDACMLVGVLLLKSEMWCRFMSLWEFTMQCTSLGNVLVYFKPVFAFEHFIFKDQIKPLRASIENKTIYFTRLFSKLFLIKRIDKI
jgi:hypothetical protein